MTERIVAGGFVCKFERSLDLRLVKSPFLPVVRLSSDLPSLISAHFFDMHWRNMINDKLAISFSGIFCPSDFLMIEIIHDHRMSLRDSSIRHFIIHKGAIILLSHFLSFYFKRFKVAAVMLVIDLIVKRYKIRMFFGDIIHNRLLETTP